MKNIFARVDAIKMFFLSFLSGGYRFPVEARLYKVKNGYVLFDEYYSTLDSAILELNNRIRDEMSH